ncbi:MAG TPA: hypothetical protein VMA53_19135 [Stellaceae bacterium]|nr:hypothetical protein [Stellaceae bacterium]
MLIKAQKASGGNESAAIEAASSLIERMVRRRFSVANLAECTHEDCLTSAMASHRSKSTFRKKLPGANPIAETAIEGSSKKPAPVNHKKHTVTAAIFEMRMADNTGP